MAEYFEVKKVRNGAGQAEIKMEQLGFSVLDVDDIYSVLDEAWQKFAGGNVGAQLGEKDYEFEEFVLNKLMERGAKGVVWYTDIPNCRFIVNTGSKFYDVDYVSYDVDELDEDEAIERAMQVANTEEEAKEYLGITDD